MSTEQPISAAKAVGTSKTDNTNYSLFSAKKKVEKPDGLPSWNILDPTQAYRVKNNYGDHIPLCTRS